MVKRKTFRSRFTPNHPIRLDPTKEVYIKDEGDFVSIRVKGKGEIGFISPRPIAVREFQKFLNKNKIPYESEYNKKGHSTWG